MTRCVATAAMRNSESLRINGDTVWSMTVSFGLRNQFSTIAPLCEQYTAGLPPNCLGDDPTQRPSTRDIASHDQVRMQPRCFYWQTANLFDPFAAAARSPATKSSLSSACCAKAAAIFQKILHILPPIVEGDFFFRLDSAHCYDYDPALAAHWFCIRPAGMIDVTRRVPSRRAVDGPSLVDLELISGAACLTPIGFFGGNAPAAIRRDIDPSLDWLCREQTEPSDRTTNPKGARGHRSRIAANFHNVTSNRRDVRVLLSEEIGDHCLRCVMRLEHRSRRRQDAHLNHRARCSARGNRQSQHRASGKSCSSCYR